MSKPKHQSNDPDLQHEYDFSRGERGKYAGRFEEGSNVIVLDADVARRFTDSHSVNEALRSLVREQDKRSGT